ncbi:hypothetical protein FNX48_020265 [Streptomyces sp. IF17]|nr:hypothetical protein [Streptomyces alkaliphilus]
MRLPCRPIRLRRRRGPRPGPNGPPGTAPSGPAGPAGAGPRSGRPGPRRGSTRERLTHGGGPRRGPGRQRDPGGHGHHRRGRGGRAGGGPRYRHRGGGEVCREGRARGPRRGRRWWGARGHGDPRGSSETGNAGTPRPAAVTETARRVTHCASGRRHSAHPCPQEPAFVISAVWHSGPAGRTPPSGSPDGRRPTPPGRPPARLRPPLP